MLAPTATTRRRAALTRRLREFFWDQEFTEVDTFVAIRAPAPEAGIRWLPVSFRLGPQGHAREQRFLQTSPELAMKRLLAGGWRRIFQLAPVFRDGDLGPWHRPEFRLLEWYRRDAGWHDAMADCEALMRHLSGEAASLNWRGRRIDLTPPYPRLSMESLFTAHAGFSILESAETASLAARLRAADIYHRADDTWSDLFHRAFLARVQPALEAMDRPVFVTHFPAPQAALARLCPTDPRAAERFEWLVAGCELANGFGELTCTASQRQRFVAEAAHRGSQGEPAAPLDEAFLADLGHLPPSAGCAVGWERLLMILCDAADFSPLEYIPWAAA